MESVLEKRQIVEKYIRCEQHTNKKQITTDSVAENGLEAADITDEIMERFVK
ncbi:MAG: hypothetical protein Q4F24_05370 [Eubacteriales bacterium]|nr:hypothetical protein [Eubacteriales bacterium]